MEPNPGRTNQNEDKSRIEELKKRLYSQKGVERDRFDAEELHEKSYGVAEEWRREELVLPEKPSTTSRFTFMQKLLFVSVIFFVGALGFSGFLFYGKGNTISAEKIELGVTGPISIGGGEPLSFTVTLRNKNSIPLLGAKLTVEYPDGTRSVTNLATPLPRSIETIGDLASGAIIQRTEKAVLFGEENDKRTIRLLLEYRVSGSNATFSKSANYDILMNASPIRVAVDSITEISAGQIFDFTFTITSNSTSVVQNVLLKAEYPFGFQFKEATPKPAFDNNIWTLGDIAPGTTKTIRLVGTLQGQDEEERIFKFSSGLQSQDNEKNLETTFTALSRSIIIKKPFLGVDLTIDGDGAAEHASSFGKMIRGEITWSNNLPTPILDASIQVAFSGASLDKASVEANQGFYQSLSNSIIWDKSNIPNLARIEPGESGRATFNFATLPIQTLSSSGLKNASISLALSAKGRRVGDTNAPEEINATASKTVKFSSQLLLNTRISHLNVPFTNTGPIPPKAEKETTYTVYFTVLNSSNIVRGTRVEAQLPNYVKWLGVKNPAGEDISFDQNSKTVTWNIGDLRQTGSVGRVAAFQVSILPSVSQIGSSPEVIKNPVVTGEDQFTKIKLQGFGQTLTTTTGDVGAQTFDGNVTP